MKNLLRTGIVLSLILTLGSCDKFVKKVDPEYSSLTSQKKGTATAIIFSHNINGETQPCGCRHFPLGGFAQVAGALHFMKGKHPYLYVDTGDAFFPSSQIANYNEKSLKHIARSIRDSFNQLDLKFFLPGDQDFAAGVPFFKELMKEASFTILASNLKSSLGVKFKKTAVIKSQGKTLFLTGLMSPELYQPAVRSHLTSPKKALKEAITQLKAEGFDPKNPHHSLVVLSHSGMETDQKLAKSFSEIDWIVGAHSQSFTAKSFDIGETRLVQVLSRNHYLGLIRFPYSPVKKANPQYEKSYARIEIRQNWEGYLSPNPVAQYLQRQTTTLSQIQEQEQLAMTKQFSHSLTDKYSTVARCQTCHQEQAQFWQGTVHSISYLTLVKEEKQFTGECLKCHTLGHKEPKGFISQRQILLDEKGELSNKKWQTYWKAFQKEVVELPAAQKSLRSLKEDKIREISTSWEKLDKKLGIEKNYTNVQCLNCHALHAEHPYEDLDQRDSQKNQIAKMKANCLSCHSNDQSRHWYEDAQGILQARPNEELFLKHFRRMSCPKIER
jgi:hypothetical protein